MESFEELIDLQIANEEKAMKKAWYYKLNGVLVKKLKPCHKNDKVHIHRWEGCYNVHEVSINGFTIRKNGEFIELPWAEFRCKSGEGDSPEKTLKVHKRFMIREIESQITSLNTKLKRIKGG